MPPETRRRLPSQVVLLGIVSLLNDTASELIFPLLPVFLTTTLGATPVVIGVIEGAADGLASILKFFAGWWSDRASKRKPLIVSGYGLAAASRALIAAATAWSAVLAARLIDRTGKGIRSAPRDAMISDVTPAHERGRAFGFQRALDHTGAVIGPLLAFVLLEAFRVPLRTIFYLAVIPGAIGVVLLLFALHEEPRAEMPKRSERVAPSGKSTGLAGAIFCVALFSLANSSDAFLLLQAHAAGVSTAMLPLLWSAHHLVKSLFSTAGGALSDRVDRRRMLATGWTLYAMIYAAFPFAHSLTAFVALFVIYAVPFTLIEGTERAWIADLVPPEQRGRSFGIFYLATGLCVLGGTTLFGAIYQWISKEAAFFTGAGFSIAAAAMVMAQRKR